MKKFLDNVFLDRTSWWGFWKCLIGCAVLSVIISVGVVSMMYSLNSGAASACEELSGDLTVRGFNCVLPTGEIVDPELYLGGDE